MRDSDFSCRSPPETSGSDGCGGDAARGLAKGVAHIGVGEGELSAPYVFRVKCSSLFVAFTRKPFWCPSKTENEVSLRSAPGQCGEPFCGPTHRITTCWWARRQTIESRPLSHVLEATPRRGKRKRYKRTVEARSALRPVARVVDDLVERAYEVTPLSAPGRRPPIIDADIGRRVRDVLTKSWIFDLSSPRWLVIFHFAYSRK